MEDSEDEHFVSDHGTGDENNNDVYDDDEIEMLIAREEEGAGQSRPKRIPKTVKYKYGTSDHFFPCVC